MSNKGQKAFQTAIHAKVKANRDAGTGPRVGAGSSSSAAGSRAAVAKIVSAAEAFQRSMTRVDAGDGYPRHSSTFDGGW